MEVDERLRWLESRVSSSLHPQGEKLRNLLSNGENRTAFIDFCNNSEVRQLFVHCLLQNTGSLCVSLSPPNSLCSKALFFLKSSFTSRLYKDTIANEVTCTEASHNLLEHLELVVREIYLPLLSEQNMIVSAERVLDILHRMVNTVQVTQGQQNGDLVLPIPSLNLLLESAVISNHEKRSVVIHIMESCVIIWMKQIKMAMHFDPTWSILKSYGKMAGPMAEINYWESRLQQLILIRKQLCSIEVLRILNVLEHALSAYAEGFIDVHKDINKVITDTEHIFMYVNTLKPSFAKFHSITSPEDLLKIIPSLMTSVALVWQYSGFYSVASNFHRLLRLISNELAEHVRQIIGPNPLICLDEACVNIKLALRVGSAFRGHYLDKKDSVEKMLVQQKEQPNKIQQESVCLAPSKESFLFAVSSSLSFFSKPTIMDVNNISSQPCAWPPRNSPVFTSLNLTMERCNDLLELVQTIEHFNELSAIADQSLGDVHDPALANIFRQFLQTIAVFKCSLTDLMNLEDSGFERSFFEFRSSVKELETQLSIVLLKSMEDCLSMESSLRLLESFQGLISRESSQLILRPKLYLIIDSIQADIDSIGVLLPNYMFDTPTLVNTPVVSAKLLWLQALKQRVNVPIEKIRKAAPYLLQGEKGFILRHSHSELMKKIEHDWSDIISQWIRNVPAQIQQSINEPILRQEDETGEVQVNFSPKFEKIVKEVDYITGPVLNVNCQYSSIISLFSPHKLHEHKSTLEMCIRQYNRLQLSLDPIHLSLFKHKLSLMENLLQQGVTSLNWLSLEIPDFLAQIKADLLNDILPAIEFVKQQSDMIRCIAQTWKKLPNLDVFFNIERVSMQYLKYTYKNVTESARSMLSFSMMQIESIIKETFKYVEVSLKSSEWLDYLSYLDALVYHGLKEMMIYSMWTLTSRAQKYEQGGSIPPIVSVSIQLWDNQIQFYPPLSLHSAIVSVPEIVKDSLESFLLLCKIPCRLIDSDISYYDELLSDGDVYGNVQKIIAHIETSSRQCQSMCKRFSQYSFLWEQDVLATFDDFIHGVGLPHPQKFTRPETVNRTRSASRSAKSRSHSAIPFTHTTQTTSCVLESMTGVSDWEFLKPDQSSSTTVSFKSYERNSCKTKKNPTLEDFEGEFSVFQGILERLNNYMDTVDIGWICVDQRSVKHSLISLNNKWMHVYSNYLEKKILCVLNELEVFFNDIEPQVEAINGENMDPSLIMTLVMIFNKVNLEQLVMDGKFGAVHRAVSLLDKFHHSLGHNAKKKFEMVPIKWSSLKKRLSLSKQRVAPFIQSHSEVIIQDLKQFGVEASKHHNLFLSSSCLSHQCDLTVAQSLLKEYKLKLLSLQVRATDLMELQELLQSSVVNFSLLNHRFENELTTAQQLWEKKQIIMQHHSLINSQIWSCVDINALEELCKSHMDMLNDLGACSVDWDIRMNIERSVKELQCTIPLLDSLSSKDMRPRHWKQILRYSNNLNLLAILMKNGSLEMSVLRHLTVGRFMELKLIYYSTNILAIVERASKEVAIEELLKNLEEVWLGMQFHFKPYLRIHSQEQAVSDIGVEAGRISSSHSSSIVRRKSVSSGRMSTITPTSIIEKPSFHMSGSVMLIADVEKIFDTLNHYQTYLQSLDGSIAATSFMDELNSWHKQLQTVEAVLRLWLQVQTLWIQLEEVLSSAESAQHLPTVHYNFSTVDKEWKQLLKNTVKSPNVISTCLQEELISTLDKFRATLNLCKYALLQYIEGRRIKCPWLFFIPLDDILHLVCYGSSLSVFCEILPKLICYSTGVTFNSLNNSCHSITNILSSSGNQLKLIETIECDGPVEGILNHLFYSISESLKHQLDYCLTKHGSLGGIVNGLVSIWGSNLTHQIIQLATFIIVHKQINKALNEKRQSPLELVQSLIHSLCDLSQGRSLSDVDVMSADDAINSGTDGSTVFLYGTNSHHLSYNGINISDHNKSHSVFTDHQHSLYQNLMLYLLNFQELLQEIMSEPNPLSSFKWQSVINYCYSKESCTLQSIGVTLDYGFHFTNGAPFSLSLPNEKLMLYLLQVMKQHYNGLIIANHQKVSSNVSGISVSCGYSLYPIICSSLTLHEVLINFFKGIASTGSWVYLHHFQQLTRQLMQATVEILEIIREAKVKSTCMDIKIGPGDSLKFYKLDTAFCIASTISALPLSVSKIFKSYSLNNSSVSMVIEAMLIVRGFTNVRTISQFLIRYIEESSICHLDIELIINHSAYLVHDFNNTGNESASIHITRNVHSVIAFQVISQQLSNMSLHTSTMLNQSSEQQFDKFTVVNKDHESCGEYANNNFSMKQWYLECLSMLITMWKLNLTIPYMLFEEFFPKLDVLLIVKELEKTQQEIGSQVNWSRNDIESVQVSKASDIFQIAKYKKDSQYLEDIIIQSCLAKGQLPTTDLQKFVHGLTIRLLEQKIIVVSSYWKTGKKECIDISVDVLNKIGYCPTLTSIPIDTMDITSIFGNNKKISIFSQVFSDIYLSHASHHIVVIEGLPCEELASCLEWIGNNSGNTIFFPNLTSYFIHPSVKFVISISSISAKLSFPCLFLDHNISWKSLSQNSFLQLDKGIHEHLDVLCHSFLPALIDFFAPILDKSDIVGGNDGCVLSPQHLKFHQLQLVNSMCLVLKCLLSDVQFSSADIVTNSFVYTLIWTFGSCLNKRNREFFDNWMRGTFPDILNSLTGYLWHYKLSSSFQFELCHAKVDSSYVFTSRTAAASEFVKLLFTKNAHLMLDGPCGSGKTQFLLSTVNSCLQQFSNDAVYSLMHTYVTQVSSPTSFWSQLQENIKWHSGNMYIPQESSRLLALIDDVHLSQNNGYGDIISLIAHHIHNGTILDPFSFNDHIVGGVTYIFTTDSNQAILPNDFLGDVVYLFWEDYSSSELIFIYTTLLNNHFKQSYELTTVIQFVVEAAIHIHFKLLTLFSNTKERMHYQFDINILNKIMKFLTIKLSGSASKEELLKCWLYESYWNYCVQLASVVDKERYQECVINALKKYFSESRLLPKLIEQVFFLSSHEIEDINCITMNDILTNVQREMDLITGCPFISLYNTTLTLSTYISQLLQAPHCLSSLLLIGMGHIEPLLVLIASSKGFTLQRPSQVVCSSKAILSNYNSSQFKSALKTIFINASVKNECYIVFLDHQEIPNVDYLPYVYQFVKDCSLTVEFTNEERLCVINSLRSEITQCGFKYSEKIAWQFFINRLKSNVRFLLSMPDLNFIHECGIVKFQNLLNVVGVYCQLPWSRKDLLHVTDFHLKHCSLPASLHESTCHLLSSIHLSLRDKIFCANSLICLFNDQFEYFVKRFCYDLQNWQDNLFNDNQQLNIAINTFSKAEERLQFLNEKVQREKMILDEKEKSYHQLLIQIGQDNAIAREQNKLVKKQVERIEHLQLVLPEYEHVHSLYLEDLNRIEYETKNVARHLDHQSLLELRSLTKPPVEIQELLEAVIIIIKSPSADLSWTKGAKRLMANIDRFSEMLMEFSACQEISEILLDSLQPYILKPKFNEEFLGKFYFAAGQLCCWVKGVESYHRMLQDNIRRLELRKSTVKASLQEYSEKLYQLQRKVQILEERLQGLSLSLEQSSIEKTQQNIVLSKTIEQLNEQRQFIESLKILNSSWINKKNMFLNDINDKIGQIALSSTMVTYLVSLEPQTIVLAFKDAIEPFIGENLLFINSTKFSNGLLSILNSSQDFSELASLLLNREPQETHLQQSAADVLFTSSMNIDVLKHVIVTVLLTLNPNECLNLGNNNLCQLLLEVLNHPWNKWSLVYDPQCILPCILIDEWTVLNAKDISTTLIHDLEQGLIEGKKIMLSDVKLPIHPVLIPVVQAGFVWNRIDKKSLFVEMCGRRINVNLDFKLIITTENQCLPTDNPMFQSLVCSFSIINMKPSVPLVNAFLTRNSIADVPPINLMSLHSQAKELGNKLMKYLQQANDGIVDQDIVSHVDDLMKLFSKLQQKFQLQLRLLKEHSQQIKHVKPITLFASVVFVLLQTLSNAFQHLTFVWKDYTVLIQKLLDETKEYGEFRNKLFSSIIMKASRYTDRNSLRIVASCLYAVSLWDTSQPLTNLVVKQLLFIVYNEFSNQVNDFTFEIPDYIPHNIAGKVLSLPISVTFLDSIIFSMQVKQVEWENILKDMLPHQVPWKEQISEATQSEYTLEDLVTLSAVTSTAALSYITSKIFEYIQSSPVYTIMSTLFSTDKSHLPICVLHNPNDLISQGNSAHLINMLQHFLNEKGFSSISMSLGLQTESDLLSILSETNADCVCIQNIHLGSSAWLSNVSLLIEKLAARNKLVILLGIEQELTLPIHLNNQCSFISLSVLSPNEICQLPMLVCTFNPYQYLQTLLVIFYFFPQNLLLELDKIPSEKRPLIFLLSAFHAHVYCNHTSAQLLDLVYCLNHLVALSDLPILMLMLVIQSILVKLYSGTDDTITMYFCEENLINNSSINVDDRLTLPIPSITISPFNYADHIVGILKGFQVDLNTYDNFGTDKSKLSQLLLNVLSQC